ncbi:hypothetical protein ACFQJD_14745 [Haloplanus sp. GCM10025708]|uniref:hypothetical protein n=1 Tax=Haloferacaceae TaxID=1644056 RepID=UPI0036108420
MSALGHLGRAVANGLVAVLAYVAASLLVLGSADWRGGVVFAVALAVAVFGLSVWQGR